MDVLKGVSFDDYHSYRDFCLIRAKKTIGAPTPKTELIEVPGADAPLDFTEFFGDVKYNNRTVSFEFKLITPMSEFDRIYSEVQNALHGRRMKIVLDEDPDFYFLGRVSVGDMELEKNIATIPVECDCEPYKYRKEKTVVSVAVAGDTTLVLDNLRQHVVPTFDSTAAITIEFEGQRYSVSTTGEFHVPEIVLKEGENTIKLSGTSDVTISYQEGGL